ncbi:hypothetical protein RhiJN_14328 [Ceratobasidium sp. AG-Ba]|nr:hypothetical protein RhiJN_14328 [Ceratobasidium sp. AG-Ba]QRW14878.1 hypothetical protein RhiLY_13877 [Ceratobasidium sp. AG-Ba]
MAYERTHWERTDAAAHPFATPPVRTATLRPSNESLGSTSRRGPPPFSPPRSNPPQTPSSSSARPPSSRRALTAALELAQEAVRIDSSGTEPLAAIAAYGKSVALLNEVMERVMRGEDANRRRSGVRRRSDAAREDEVRRLKSIHDTYADRMQILSLIYNMDSNQSPPDDASPDTSPHVPTTPPFPQLAGDHEQSSGFYPPDRPAFLVHDEDEEDDDPASAENVGSALENTSSLDYNNRDYLLTTRDYHSNRDYHGFSSAPPSREYTPSPLHDHEYDQPTPTEPVPTPISPTSTITPQRVSVIPPPRPPPSGPPPTLPQPPVPSSHAYAQPAYTLPQPPLPQQQPQPQARVNGGSVSLPSQPKPPLTRTQSAGPGVGSVTPAPRTDPHSPLRRSYVVSHSQAQTSVPPQPVQPAARSRSGSVAGHKRTGSGNERLGTLSEERERERSEGGNQSASSGNESESWTVVGAEAYVHQQPVAEGYRPTSAYRSRVASSARELPPLPADASPLTPRVPGNGSGGEVVQRPRGDTGSSASSRGSDGPSSAGTVSTVPTTFSVTVDKAGSQFAVTQAQTLGMLVSPSTAQGSIAQRRKSAQPSIGQAMAFEQALQSPPQPIQQPPIVSLPPPVPPLPVPPTATNTTRLTADTLPAGTASRLGIAPGRVRASSQPGRRPSGQGAEGSGSSLVAAARKASATHASRMFFPRGIPSPIPLSMAMSAAGISPPHHSSPSLVVHVIVPTIPKSAPISRTPSSPQRRPFHLMACLHASLTRRSGGYLTRRLHVPHEVWSQGGAKLMNIAEKVRVVDSLVDHLVGVREASDGFFGGRRGGDEWLKRLEEWNRVCDGLVGEYGKKLGVGEGVTGKKGNRVTNMLKGGLDRITNGKNMDSPTNYTDGLKKLFSQAELFDDHIRALHDPSHPTYGHLSPHVRKQIEQRMAQASEFFATVVLTFVVRDLGLLMDKFVKKTERWLEE